jgi:hypothetical protein
MDTGVLTVGDMCGFRADGIDHRMQAPIGATRTTIIIARVGRFMKVTGITMTMATIMTIMATARTGNSRLNIEAAAPNLGLRLNSCSLSFA